ncbi:MAG: CerR family C-terminal domain-containing protein [Inquilinus sp.]|nr:CerR family C-terminal domain-containing protein [Inquilinus sp.]
MNTVADTALPNRGEDTRAQLIDAGLSLFGRLGYEAVTTRALAQEAGVNLAAIAYHFGGKKGLYQAIAEIVVADIGGVVLPRLARLRRGLAAADGDRPALARLVDGFVRGQIGTFLDDPSRQRYIPFMLREYAAPTDIFTVLYRGVVEPMHQGVTALAAAAKGLAADDPRAILTAHTLFGQMVGFRVGKAPLLRRLGWDDYTPDRIQAIADVVAPMALAALGLPPVDAAAGDREAGA